MTSQQNTLVSRIPNPCHFRNHAQHSHQRKWNGIRISIPEYDRSGRGSCVFLFVTCSSWLLPTSTTPFSSSVAEDITESAGNVTYSKYELQISRLTLIQWIRFAQYQTENVTSHPKQQQKRKPLYSIIRQFICTMYENVSLWFWYSTSMVQTCPSLHLLIDRTIPYW